MLHGLTDNKWALLDNKCNNQYIISSSMNANANSKNNMSNNSTNNNKLRTKPQWITWMESRTMMWLHMTNHYLTRWFCHNGNIKPPTSDNMIGMDNNSSPPPSSLRIKNSRLLSCHNNCNMGKTDATYALATTFVLHQYNNDNQGYAISFDAFLCTNQHCKFSIWLPVAVITTPVIASQDDNITKIKIVRIIQISQWPTHLSALATSWLWPMLATLLMQTCHIPVRNILQNLKTNYFVCM